MITTPNIGLTGEMPNRNEKGNKIGRGNIGEGFVQKGSLWLPPEADIGITTPFNRGIPSKRAVAPNIKEDETIYVLLSDYHLNNTAYLVDIYKRVFDINPHIVIGNGDLGSSYKEISDFLITMHLITMHLKDTYCYVQPGNREVYKQWRSAVDNLENRTGRDRVIDMTQYHPLVQVANHNLLFIPGSFIGQPRGRGFGEGFLITPYEKSGKCKTTVIDEKTGEKNEIAIGESRNIKDYLKEAEDPAKTIIVTHDPPFIKNSKDGIDYAVTAVNELEGTIIGEEGLHVGKVEGIARKEGNVGVKELTDLMALTLPTGKALKYLAGFHGHIHTSGGKACDINGNPIKSGEYAKGILVNSACIDRNKIVVCRVNKDNEIKYDVHYL